MQMVSEPRIWLCLLQGNNGSKIERFSKGETTECRLVDRKIAVRHFYLWGPRLCSEANSIPLQVCNRQSAI